MKIKKKVLEKIAEDNTLKAQLCDALTKSIFTVQRYINTNDELLTTASALKVIRERLNLTDAQILEEISKTAA